MPTLTGLTLWRQALLLMPLTLIWVMLSKPWAPDSQSPISQLKEVALNWRYKVRGPIDAISEHKPEALKMLYADMDPATIAHIGERPWHRKLYADISMAALGLGQAKVFALDFILSPLAASEMVPPENISISDNALAEAITIFPDQIVLAGSYASVVAGKQQSPYERINGVVASSPLYPEAPGFPITDFNQGRIALIDVDINRGSSAVPQWLIAYTRYNGEIYSKILADAKIRALKHKGIDAFIESDTSKLKIIERTGNVLEELPKTTSRTFLSFAIETLCHAEQLNPADIEIHHQHILLKKNDGSVAYTIPLTDGQLIEINWFSKWNDGRHNPRISILQILNLWTVFSAAQDVELWKEYWTFPPEEQALFPLESYIPFAARQDNWDSFRRDSANDKYFKGTVFQDGSSLKDEANAGKAAYAAILFLRSALKDAIVIAGPTDTILQDLAPTPYDSKEVPKVGAHGNLLKTIYSGRFISRLPWEWHSWIIVTLGMVAAFSSLYDGKRELLFRIGGPVILLLYVFTVFRLFIDRDLVLPLIAPMGAALTVYLTGLAWRIVIEERKKGKITGMFGTYLSPELVDRMIESDEEPVLGGEDEMITAFFSDVQSFSAFAEILQPKQLVALMNEYLTEMTDIITEEGCYVDKYIGDAIVGIFNAPVDVDHHEYHACLASVRMQNKLAELRRKWESEGSKWPDIVHSMHARIGMNTGHATVGNIGSERRFNYTMMGDTVNVAARMESAAKTYGVFTLVSHSTKYAAEKHKDSFVFRKIDRIIVKGRSQPVSIYELVCMKSDLTAEIQKCVEHYTQGMNYYYKCEFDKAMTEFEISEKLEPNRKERNPVAYTTPSRVMLHRSQLLKDNPPPTDWNGVYTMLTK